MGQLSLLFHSGWTMCSAQDQKRLWTGAVFQGGAFTIAIIIQMMLELYVPTVSYTVHSLFGYCIGSI